GLCQALVNRPRLVILDEPVSGLDPVGRRELLDLLKQLKSESTILFSTHVLPDAEELSDDILIVRAGAIVIDSSLTALRARYERPIVELELDDEATAGSWLETLASRGVKGEHRGAVIRWKFETSAAMRAGAADVYASAASRPEGV